MSRNLLAMGAAAFFAALGVGSANAYSNYREKKNAAASEKQEAAPKEEAPKEK